MKAGKALKVAGALAASVALLIVLAGCGQASKPSPKSETSSSTPAKSTSQTSPSTQASPSPASSSSGSTPSSSSASSAPTGTSASTSTASSTPAASSSPASTGASTQPMPSNEVLYLLAYIKYRGGIQNITPSDLIVDEYMIGTQKGTVWPNTPPKQVPLQMVVNGKEVEVVGPTGAPPYYGTEATYPISSLVSEYYSTPAQKSQINSILQEGERHNLLDVLAVLKSQAISGTDYNGQQLVIADTSLGDNNNLGSPGGINALIVIKGGEISVCKTSSSQYNDPVYYYYYHFTSQSLINEYYSTPVQKANIDEDIRLGTKGYTPGSTNGL